jgi:hypothetical protein
LFSSGSAAAPKAVICTQGRSGMLARTMRQRTELIGRVPVTGNHRTTETGLRREAWLTDDPVYWCRDPATGYRPLRAADREVLATQFATHGRAALLPE